MMKVRYVQNSGVRFGVFAKALLIATTLNKDML
jgi:hypothetical protein